LSCPPLVAAAGQYTRTLACFSNDALVLQDGEGGDDGGGALPNQHE
jgi:hypothetical protein